MDVECTVFKGSASGSIVESTSHLDAPTGNQVLIKITHSGICGSDEHARYVDMALGHEGVGTIQQIGENVSRFRVGDMVGWGVTNKTCGNCEQCELGKEQHCPNRESHSAANFHQGAFASHALWDASWLFKIPEGMAPEHAAPLMCGGATIYNVIETYNIRPADRVGVVGIGGLGHLAIQFLAKMGVNVIAFSGTDSKREEAIRLGAAEFHATKGVENIDTAQLEHLLITTSFLPDWNLFLNIMKPTGTIYPLSAPLGANGNLTLPFGPLFFLALNVQCSLIASRAVQRRMLDFAARNKIIPIIERFPMTRDGVEGGLDKLKAGKMRYRAVLFANVE
ncbi:putative NADP-dependent alcohol dehydrogenase C 2 [Mycena vitilis]|nr:putative NADP-dependent alcohol dehydrogenase C 2 [Mycena vitilis]